MIDVIASTLSGIDAAIKITQTIEDASSAIKDASLNLHIAELMCSLADSKVQIAEIKTLLLEKGEAIQNLENKLKQTLSGEKPTFQYGCYFFEGDNNPYCTGCWDKNLEKIRTARDTANVNIRLCSVCKFKFSTSE
jgi:Mg2+ and Co2+ transporter CorA